MVSAERDMLDLVDELSYLALVPDVDPPILHLQVEASCGEGAAEHTFPGVGGDFDEATCPGRDGWLSGDPRHVDVAFPINLQVS